MVCAANKHTLAPCGSAKKEPCSTVMGVGWVCRLFPVRRLGFTSLSRSGGSLTWALIATFPYFVISVRHLLSMVVQCSSLLCQYILVWVVHPVRESHAEPGAFSASPSRGSQLWHVLCTTSPSLYPHILYSHWRLRTSVFVHCSEWECPDGPANSPQRTLKLT
jgi:hypothetical protein